VFSVLAHSGFGHRHLLFLSWLLGFMVAFVQFIFPLYGLFDKRAFSDYLYRTRFLDNEVDLTRQEYDHFIGSTLTNFYSDYILTTVSSGLSRG
jgi:hypothetical protein